MSSSKPSFSYVATARVLSGLLSSAFQAFVTVGVFAWDGGLALYNLVAPDLPKDAVVPEGCKGARGVWPTYIPPVEGDSRCCCPALNAMANHGAWESSRTSDRARTAVMQMVKATESLVQSVVA